MFEVIEDTLLDVLKIIPFLFIAFLIIEYLEHKFNKKMEKKIKKAGRFGPIIGSLLGTIPQCGLSIVATNLYVTRIITLGTLISIYLSSSDEMLLIMLAEKADIRKIIFILLIKIIIGFIFGFIIDILVKKSDKADFNICKDEHCHCDDNYIKSAIKHTLKISSYILIFIFILNVAFYYIGEDNIKNIFSNKNILTPFLSGLFGLIPNCGPSVILTELYLNNVLSIGQCISGLLTNSGLALLVLFRTNKNIKENVKITLILYTVGVLCGILLDLIL